MSGRRPTIPEMRLHKASGQCYVNLNGRRKYLGRSDSPDVQANYDRAIQEWLACGRNLPAPAEGLLIVELLERYWTYAKGFYDQEGTHIGVIRGVIRDIRRLYGSDQCEAFGPLALRALREHWITEGAARTTANKKTSITKAIFRWGVSHELVKPQTLTALAAVEGLKAGRTQAREPKQVLPVPLENVEAVKPHVSRQVWALIQLQLLTGARTSEICYLRPVDLDTSGEVWTVRLDRHKSAHRGKRRTLYFGPRAQAVIRPFLQDRAVSAYLFSPKDAVRERAAQATTHRRKNQKANPRKTTRTLSESYDRYSYARAIRRACKKAGVPHWHPHQLRHNHGTEVRKQSGLEAASIALGHSRVDTSELYAEKNEAVALEIAKELG